jgi:hypothetical protein
MPMQELVMTEKLTHISGLPLAYTYTGLIDTPFVAFFDTYANPQEMGLGPVDGCYFEPTAYFIIQDRIYKR